MGRDKRAHIVALRQAKFYPPRQAAAAAIHEVECSSARGLQLVEHSISCIAAARALWQLQV